VHARDDRALALVTDNSSVLRAKRSSDTRAIPQKRPVIITSDDHGADISSVGDENGVWTPWSLAADQSSNVSRQKGIDSE
jgi:hypothetical protein